MSDEELTQCEIAWRKAYPMTANQAMLDERRERSTTLYGALEVRQAFRDGYAALEAENAGLRARVEALAQVAVEAMRLVAGKGSPAEPCRECGLPGIGPMRDALAKTFGSDWGRLLHGNDGNVDRNEFRAALTPTTAGGTTASPPCPDCGSTSAERSAGGLGWICDRCPLIWDGTGRAAADGGEAG
jgi:hypothetical protein